MGVSVALNVGIAVGASVFDGAKVGGKEGTGTGRKEGGDVSEGLAVDGSADGMGVGTYVGG